MRSLGWALIHCAWGPHKKRRSGHTHRGTTVWGHREKTAVCTPRREASALALLTPGPRPPASRTGDSECLWFKISSVGLGYGCPGTPIRVSMFSCGFPSAFNVSIPFPLVCHIGLKTLSQFIICFLIFLEYLY